MPFPLSAVFGIGEKLIDRLIPDKEAREKAKHDLLKMQQDGELAVLAAETDLLKGQLEINKTEAASGSLWVAGWRPFVGWVCGSAFAYGFIVQPFLVFVLTAAGRGDVLATLPELDLAGMMPVLMGMLGLAGMRTYEKVAGKISDGS